MIAKTLSTADLERVHDAIAEGLDRAGLERDRLFLAKLALALANQLGDADAVDIAIEAALRDL
jgi:hypothetical protein